MCHLNIRKFMLAMLFVEWIDFLRKLNINTDTLLGSEDDTRITGLAVCPLEFDSCFYRFEHMHPCTKISSMIYWIFPKAKLISTPHHTTPCHATPRHFHTYFHLIETWNTPVEFKCYAAKQHTHSWPIHVIHAQRESKWKHLNNIQIFHTDCIVSQHGCWLGRIKIGMYQYNGIILTCVCVWRARIHQIHT